MQIIEYDLMDNSEEVVKEIQIKVEDFIDLFKKVPKIDAGLAASVFHFGEIEIKNLKKILSENGIEMRL